MFLDRNAMLEQDCLTGWMDQKSPRCRRNRLSSSVSKEMGRLEFPSLRQEQTNTLLLGTGGGAAQSKFSSFSSYFFFFFLSLTCSLILLKGGRPSGFGGALPPGWVVCALLARVLGFRF